MEIVLGAVIFAGLVMVVFFAILFMVVSVLAKLGIIKAVKFIKRIK